MYIRCFRFSKSKLINVEWCTLVISAIAVASGFSCVLFESDAGYYIATIMYVVFMLIGLSVILAAFLAIILRVM